MPRPRAARPALTRTAMITRITTMIMGTTTTIIITTTIMDTPITRTTTPAAIIQITSMIMGGANDLEAERPELPMTALRP